MVDTYLNFPPKVNTTPNWTGGSLMCHDFSNTANSETTSTIQRQLHHTLILYVNTAEKGKQKSTSKPF